MNIWRVTIIQNFWFLWSIMVGILNNICGNIVVNRCWQGEVDIGDESSISETYRDIKLNEIYNKVFSNRLLLVCLFHHPKQPGINVLILAYFRYPLRWDQFFVFVFVYKISPCFLSLNSSVLILFLIGGRSSLGFLLIAHITPSALALPSPFLHLWRTVLLRILVNLQTLYVFTHDFILKMFF